jgi:hypothetical protein
VQIFSLGEMPESFGAYVRRRTRKHNWLRIRSDARNSEVALTWGRRVAARHDDLVRADPDYQPEGLRSKRRCEGEPRPGDVTTKRRFCRIDASMSEFSSPKRQVQAGERVSVGPGCGTQWIILISKTEHDECPTDPEAL